MDSVGFSYFFSLQFYFKDFCSCNQYVCNVFHHNYFRGSSFFTVFCYISLQIFKILNLNRLVFEKKT
jgi:hypothetical protein